MATASKKTLFVLQPFTAGADALFQLIASAAAPEKVSVVRADTIPDSGQTIADKIDSAISIASLIVAEVSDSNPNVMYEVGLARARGKAIIFVASSSRNVPFDLAAARFVIYDTANPEDFVGRLGKAIGEALASPTRFRAASASREREKRPNVFISYSHTDVEYLDRLLVHLKPLEKAGLLDLWVDTRLRAGDKWRREIEKALQRATVAVLLVSADFLASDFITEDELPPLLKNAEEQGTRVIPLIVKPCRFTRDKSLRAFQSVSDPKKALILLSTGQQELIYDQVASEIERSLQKA